MTQSFFGSNVDLPYVRDYGRFLEYHRRLDPVVMTLIVDKPEQREKLLAAARDLPNAKIIARVWHELDGAFHLPPQAPGDNRPEIASAEGYIDEFSALGKGNLILSVLNEPTAFNPLADQVKLVDWCVRGIKRADETQTQIILPNWADRNPFVSGGMWAPDVRVHGANAPIDLYDPMLLAIANAKHPDLFCIGLHLYGPDRYIDTLGGLVGRCAWLDIPCPPVYVTEYGLDSVFSGDPQNGYVGRMPGDGYARWHANELAGVLRPYAERGIVRGVTTFGYGHTGKWIGYDVEPDRVFQDTMITLKEEGKLSIPVIPIAQSVAKPTNPGPGRKVICRKFRNIRSGPSTRYHDDGDLPAGTLCTVYDQAPMTEVLADGSRVSWWWMESEKGNGWIQSTNWVCENAPVTPEPPPTPAPVTPPATPAPAEPPTQPNAVKLWAIGLKIKATEAQKQVLLDGLEHLLLACAMIGQAVGAEIEVVAKEATA